MAKKDYYETLGIDRGVDAKELKKAYRRVAMKYHPDRAPNDTAAEEKFKEASEAYEVLSDADKRAAYDRYGHDAVDPSRGGGAGAGAGGFEDIFGDIFGGRGGRAQKRGSDLQYNLELDLEKAVLGTETKIRVPTLVKCSPCNGSGAKPGTSKHTCGTCNGQGQVRMSQGFFSVQQTCPHCQGQGTVIAEPCNTCHGQGRQKESKTLAVKVPAGVDTGDRIRLVGEGEAGPNGSVSGDLYVQISIKSHSIFVRDGANLHCEIPLGFTTAALGGEIEVPTLSGRIKLRIPAETQTGKRFRLRGKGIKPVRGTTAGDLLCAVTVETPVRLSDKQKELLKNFDETLDKNHSPRKEKWFDGVKRFFDRIS